MATVARLTLSEALAGDRLSDFVDQAEGDAAIHRFTLSLWRARAMDCRASLAMTK
jgi:hypothetical protein